MKKNNKLPGRNFIVTLLIMLVGSGAICGIIGTMVSKLIVSPQMGSIIGWVLVELLVLVCSYAAVRKLPQNRLIAAVIISALFMLMRIGAGLILFPSTKIELLSCIATLGVGIMAGVLASMKKQRRR